MPQKSRARPRESSAADKKMASKNEAIGRKLNFESYPQAKAETPRTLDSQALDAEARQVAVADRDLRALHEKAVDGGQQAAEQRGRGHEDDGGSLGHCCPLFCVAEQFRFVVWD